MKKYKIIGLTGQTGAGKSTVSAVLAKGGAAVIDADRLVAELYKPESVCLRVLSAEFGEDIILPDKSLDRKKLAQRAFSAKEKTALLGSLIHPFVLSLFLEKAESLVKDGKKLIVFDAPQLFESRANVICDYIISITAEESLRRQRIMNRDSISEEMAESRINAQLPESYFKENSDFILENNGSQSELISKTEGLLGYLRQVI